MTLKVVHLIDEIRVGGAQTHLVTMLAEMAGQKGFEHEVLVLFEEATLAEDIRSMGIPVEVLDLRQTFQARRYDLALRAVRNRLASGNYDILEAHLTWSRLLGLPAARSAGICGRIGFEHGDIYLNGPHFRAANFASQFLVDPLIVCSSALEQWVRKTHGISRNRMKVMHNCVDTNRFAPKPLKRQSDWPDSAVIACTVGTLGEGVTKRVDVSIRAVAAARASGADIGMVVCGDGPLRPQLEALVDGLKLNDAIHFLGERRDVDTVLRSADVFCHAAPFEPFGIVCIEAMAVGLPVIIPDSGGIVEAVTHGHDGIIYEAMNHAALGRALVDMSDGVRRLKMGGNARSTVLERFTAASYASEMLELYSSVVETKTKAF